MCVVQALVESDASCLGQSLREYVMSRFVVCVCVFAAVCIVCL
jgi:hypothetical protein